MYIIGITGPTGAGKDTAADYLAQQLGLPHVSGSRIVREMLRATGLEMTKEAVRNFSIFLRTQYGPEVVIEHALALQKGQAGLIVSGFRALVEAETIKHLGGFVVYVDAPVALRYERILHRARAGDASDKAHFVDLDQKEQGVRQDSDENLIAIKSMADAVIVNDGTLAELHTQLHDLAARLRLSA